MSDAAPEKKKRTLPEALQKFKFQKGHKRAVKPAAAPVAAPVAATPAARPSPQAAVTAANKSAVRYVGMGEWLGLTRRVT